MSARDRAEAPGRPRDQRWWLLAAAVTVVLLADQGTKYLAVRDLTFLFERADVVSLYDRVEIFYTEDRVGHLARAPVVIVDGLWRHRYSENRGASFNLLRTAPAGFRRVFFTLVTAMATVFVLLMTHRAPHRRPVAVLGLGALLGGALGNLVDRLSRGYVIDFIDWHVRAYPRLHWPTFNLADVGITVGAVVLLWQLAREALGHDA